MQSDCIISTVKLGTITIRLLRETMNVFSTIKGLLPCAFKVLFDLAFDGLEAFMEEGAEVGCGVA